ncbi:MAG: VUT family protein, partial [Thermodesulfobacteriota bacterium]|nr:VUT family protein [Thermodesulfobacteriota bacterium]
KIATRGKWLWVRTITSTLIGQGLDSLIFITLSFVGTMPVEALFLAILTQWIVKFLYEAMVTPITYKVVNFLKIHEGVDAYDYDTNFSPLTFSRQ